MMDDRTGVAMDDRAVSITLTYVLTIAITTVLVAGLIVASATMVESQRDRSAESELTAVGERLASEITALDRTVDANQSTVIETSYPTRVADTTYRISSIESGDHPLCDIDSCLLLETDDGNTEVVIPIGDDVDVRADATVTGGAVDVAHDGEEITFREGSR